MVTVILVSVLLFFAVFISEHMSDWNAHKAFIVTFGLVSIGGGFVCCCQRSLSYVNVYMCAYRM